MREAAGPHLLSASRDCKAWRNLRPIRGPSTRSAWVLRIDLAISTSRFNLKLLFWRLASAVGGFVYNNSKTFDHYGSSMFSIYPGLCVSSAPRASSERVPHSSEKRRPAIDVQFKFRCDRDPLLHSGKQRHPQRSTRQPQSL